MKTNIHPIERGIRVVAGIFLISFAFWGPSNPWFLLGIIPIATGLSGWCPMYTMLGISTCPAKYESSIKQEFNVRQMNGPQIKSDSIQTISKK